MEVAAISSVVIIFTLFVVVAAVFAPIIVEAMVTDIGSNEGLTIGKEGWGWDNPGRSPCIKEVHIFSNSRKFQKASSTFSSNWKQYNDPLSGIEISIIWELCLFGFQKSLRSHESDFRWVYERNESQVSICTEAVQIKSWTRFQYQQRFDQKTSKNWLGQFAWI